MATLSAGSTVTLPIQGHETYTVVTASNSYWKATFTPTNPAHTAAGCARSYGPLPVTQAVGPFGVPGSLALTVDSQPGGSITYTSSAPYTIGDGAQLTRAVTRYKPKYQRGVSRLIGLGDSYMTGSGASTTPQSFYGLLSTELASNYQAVNYGWGNHVITAFAKAPLFSGSGPATTELWQSQIDDVVFGIFGLNDIRGISDLAATTGGCGVDPANLRAMICRMQALATWFMVPETARVRAHTQNNSGANPAVTFAGSWTHTGSLGGYANVSYTTAINSTATFTSPSGDLLVLRTLAASGATATWSVTVDGVLLYNGSSKGEFDTNWVIESHIIKLPSKGAHTVVVKHLTGDNLVFHSCDCVDTSTDFSSTFVYSTPGNIPDGAGLGWSNTGGIANGATANSATGSAIWLYNAGGLERFRAAIDTAMSSLFELGFNVVNVRHYVDWNINVHVNADNIHPNDAGHLLIASSFRHPLRLLAGV